MIELERTFLAKSIPENIKEWKDMKDIYIPKDSNHPVIRIRRDGNSMVITKKEPIEDASHQKEQTIILTNNEFESLSRIDGEKIVKKRGIFDFNNLVGEIDIFQDELKGLVLIDFEFETKEERDSFEMPDFCLAEVTHEISIAGGMLAGKSYSDIEEDLKKYNYSKIL